MAVLRALQRVPGALVRNPIILVVFGLYTLLMVPQFVAQSVSPLLSGLLSLALLPILVLAVPFLQAGTIRMADEALGGETSFGAFVGAGKANYVSVLVAYLLVVVVNSVLGGVAFVVALVGGAFALGTDGGLSTGGIVALAVVVGLFALVYLAFAFLIQFYAQEIVLNDASALEGLKQSAGLVRSNVVSTLGYFVVVLVFSGGISGGIGALMALLMPTQTGTTMVTPELTTMLLVSAVYLVVVPIMGSALTVYTVAFWRELRGPDAPTGSAGATDATVA